MKSIDIFIFYGISVFLMIYTSWHSFKTNSKNIMTNIKYLKKLSKKDYSEAIILTITYIIVREFFSDFDHFIAGLFGF